MARSLARTTLFHVTNRNTGKCVVFLLVGEEQRIRVHDWRAYPAWAFENDLDKPHDPVDSCEVMPQEEWDYMVRNDA